MATLPMIQSNPKGAAHERSGNSFRGGVSHRFTRRPKGQSTVEYVLIIAIIVLVVLIAGPWVSSVIRNQFNLVAGAIGSGTAGENFYEPQDIPDPESGTAFAVYSADDHSLMFYKRRGVPKVGDMFNYRRVTEVYTGFETDRYYYYSDDPNGDDNTPWYEHHNDILSVDVVDYGIRPASLFYWFHRFDKCVSFDVAKLDTSLVTSITHVFYCCGSVKALDLSHWDLSSISYAVSSFAYCVNLESVSFGELPFPNLENGDWMFCLCPNLKLDCSEWNVKSSASHGNFSPGSPGIILPRNWQ